MTVRWYLMGRLLVLLSSVALKDLEDGPAFFVECGFKRHAFGLDVQDLDVICYYGL